ncbi:MAG: hypothetical protein ABMA64_14760, partial [Myxococcota bacterium]
SGGVDRFAELVFDDTCASGTLAVEAARDGGWTFAAPVPVGCAGVLPADVTAAQDALGSACSAGGGEAAVCAGAAADLGAELDKLAARRVTAQTEFFPYDPAELPIRGSDAEMEIRFTDGTSERWLPGEKPWGTRFVRLEADGAVSAQGSMLFQPSPGTALGCAAVRDHTMSGRIDAPGQITLVFVEVSELTCDSAVSLQLELHQTFIDPG